VRTYSRGADKVRHHRGLGQRLHTRGGSTAWTNRAQRGDYRPSDLTRAICSSAANWAVVRPVATSREKRTYAFSRTAK
jgi:hypothetical protein